MLKQKARILVTHQLQCLTAADSILILDEVHRKTASPVNRTTKVGVLGMA